MPPPPLSRSAERALRALARLGRGVRRKAVAETQSAAC